MFIKIFLIYIISVHARAELHIQGAQLSTCISSNKKCVKVSSHQIEDGELTQTLALTKVRIEEFENGLKIESEDFDEGYYQPQKNIIVAWKKSVNGRVEKLVDLDSAQVERLEIKR